jgi:hypothetical protein
MTTAGQRRIYEARPQLVALMTALSSGDAKAAVDLIRGKTLAETGTLLIAAIEWLNKAFEQLAAAKGVPKDDLLQNVGQRVAERLEREAE